MEPDRRRRRDERGVASGFLRAAGGAIALRVGLIEGRHTTLTSRVTRRVCDGCVGTEVLEILEYPSKSDRSGTPTTATEDAATC